MDLEETLDLHDRVPCPDGACIGVLDAHGVCGTCGRLGEIRTFRGSQPVVDPDSSAAAHTTTPEPTVEVPEPTAEVAHDADERVPCPDEGCTGILGAEGRCGVCGRAS